MEPASNLYTKDQKVKFLVDDALFSMSLSARVRAVNQLSKDYQLEAIPIIEEVVKILPATDIEFKAFCAGVIDKIREQAERGERKFAGLWV